MRACDGEKTTAPAIMGRVSISAPVLHTLAVLGIVRLISSQFRTLGVDIAVYQAGGNAVLAGASLYDLRAGHLHLPFTYPPFAALAFTLLHPVPRQLLWILSLLVNLFLLRLFVQLMAEQLAIRLTSRKAWLLVAASNVLAPVAHTVELGQINVLLLVLIVVDAFVIPRRYRGVLTGVAAGLKLTPAIFGLYFLVTRQWRAAAVSFISAAATVLIGWLLLPEESARYWLHIIRDANRPGSLDYVGNASVTGLILRIFPAPPGWLIPALMVLLVIFYGVMAARFARAGAQLYALTTVGLLGCSVSPLSWDHHWVWFAVIGMWAVAVKRRAWMIVALVPFICVPSRLPAGLDAIAAAAYPTGAVAWVVAVYFDLFGSDRRGKLPPKSNGIAERQPSHADERQDAEHTV